MVKPFTPTKDSMPFAFIILLTIFVGALFFFNIDSFLEKLGIETKATALVKLANANKEIEALIIANQKLVKELELRNKVTLANNVVTQDLATKKLEHEKAMVEIEHIRLAQLQKLKDEPYIDDYFEENKSLYNLPVEQPKQNNNTNNESNKATIPINKKPLPLPSSKSKASNAKTKSNKRSEIQIAALWETYETLHVR